MSRGAGNDAAGFGWVSRFVHWTMAAAILCMLAFGTYLGRTEPSLANLWMYGLHKSVGLCLLAFHAKRIDPIEDFGESTLLRDSRKRNL